MIVVEPLETAVTFPDWSTLAIASSALSHTKDLSVVEFGMTEALRTNDSPSLIVLLVISKETSSAAWYTVTSHDATLPPSFEVTEIMAVPADFAKTTPLSTDATSGLSLLHVTSLLVASSGRTVAASVNFSPNLFMVFVDSFKETLLT